MDGLTRWYKYKCRTNMPREWRDNIFKERWYGASCFVYSMLYIFWNSSDVVGEDVPLWRHASVHVIAPYYVFLQGIASFLNDYYYFGIDSFFHTVDRVMAPFGACLFLDILLFEYLDTVQYVICTACILHMLIAYSHSYYHGRVSKDFKRYVWWHVQWHISCLWIFLLFFYTRLFTTPNHSIERWYPEPSFIWGQLIVVIIVNIMVL